MTEFKIGDLVKINLDRKCGAFVMCAASMMDAIDNTHGTIVGILPDGSLEVSCDALDGDLYGCLRRFFPHELEPLNND